MTESCEAGSNRTKKASGQRRCTTDSSRLAVVGIGASAGGLSALKTFFKNMPEQDRLAIVLVMHLIPDQESHLAEVLQPHGNMPVIQVNEEMQLEPRHVYVIPPGHNLRAIDTHIRVTKLEENRKQRAPVDRFLRTLANAHTSNAIAVILSGTGSDGVLGIKEIKEKGGLTIAQEPNECEFDGMPRSAIAGGFVDFVSPVKQIPNRIVRYVNTHPRLILAEDGEPTEEGQKQCLQRILAEILTRTNRDFSRYKPSTLMRRVRKRMQLHHIEDLTEYVDYLREKPSEVSTLCEELLVTVTNFFRDPETFQALEGRIVPELFKNKEPSDCVRAWSVGCATGEEGYSIAMLLLDYSARLENPPQVQVFASDIHEPSLLKARKGLYCGDIDADVSAERLRRHFVKEHGGYRVRKDLRERIIFSPHDLLKDPPFSRIDLIVCLNLLIYLQREMQRDVIELFHYALKPEGYLVLGHSETIDSGELFQVEDKGNSIFKKRNVRGPEPRLPVYPLTKGHYQSGEEAIESADVRPVSHGPLHQRMVEKYALPSLLINPDYKVVHLSEHAGRYLNAPGGEFTTNILRIIREELRIELRTALFTAKDKKEVVRSKPVPMQIEGRSCWVILCVSRAWCSEEEGFTLVVFEELAKDPGGSASSPSLPSKAGDADLRELETELEGTRERLQGVIDEYETSQEEMQASNEELQSTNEELQSMNEELQTLNQENRHKVEQLSRLSGDLQNFMAATNIATLFLNRNLAIQRFTPKAEELFRIRAMDQGRPIADLTHCLHYNTLLSDARQVMQDLIPIEKEVRDENGKWYLTRIFPYRSEEDRIEGLVLTFVDITARKRSEESLKESRAQFRALVEASSQIVWTTNQAGEMMDDSPSWRAFTGQTYEAMKGWGWLEALHPQERASVQATWQKHIQEGTFMNTEFRLFYAASNHYRRMAVRAVPLRNENDRIRGWVGMNTDITNKKREEEEQARLAAIVQSSQDGIINQSLDGGILSWNPAAERMFGYTAEQALGNKVFDLIVPPEQAEVHREAIRHIVHSGEGQSYETVRMTKSGQTIPVFLSLSPVRDTQGRIIGISATDTDISSWKKTVAQRERLNQTLASMLKAFPDIVWVVNRDRQIEFLNPAANAFFSEFGQQESLPQEITDQIDSTLKTGKDHLPSDFRGVHRLLCQSHERYYLCRLVAIKDNQGITEGVTVMLQDVTAFRMLDEVKTNLIGTVSHELKTPLASIRMSILLLLEKNVGSLTSDQEDLILVARQEVDRLLRTLYMLLDLTRFEVGENAINPEEVDLTNLVQSAIQSVNSSMHENGVQVEMDLDRQVTKVYADYDRILHVLTNLLTNAVTHSPANGTVRVAVHAGDKNQICFSIKDSGPGIPAEHQDKLFKRFHRLPGESKSGTGLGLAIAKEFVHAHGGTIGVNSKPGEGTEFYFTLPIPSKAI